MDISGCLGSGNQLIHMKSVTSQSHLKWLTRHRMQIRPVRTTFGFLARGYGMRIGTRGDPDTTFRLDLGGFGRRHTTSGLRLAISSPMVSGTTRSGVEVYCLPQRILVIRLQAGSSSHLAS